MWDGQTLCKKLHWGSSALTMWFDFPARNTGNRKEFSKQMFVFQLKNQQQRKVGVTPTLTRLAGGGAYLVLCSEVLGSFSACMQFPKEQDFLQV